MSFSEQEIEEFKTEAFELLETAEKSLLAIDTTADFKTTFDSVFRAFHNLKGGAGMMELTAVQAHTHELETILMSFKEQTTIPKEYVSLFLKGIDGARSLLDGNPIQFKYQVDSPVAKTLAAVPNEVAPLADESFELAELSPEPLTEESAPVDATTASLIDAAAEEFLAECDEIIERVSKNLQLIEGGNFSKEIIDTLYRDFHSLKGSAYLFTYTQLGDIAHVIESSLESVREGTHLPSPALIDSLFKGLKVIEIEVNCIRTGQPDEKVKEVFPLFSQALKTIVGKLQLSKPETEVAVMNTPPESTAAASTAPANKEKETESSSIRVSVSLLDNLMTLMGEMVLVRNQVLQFSNNSEDLEFQNLSKRLNVVTSEIQDEMMKTRMQPIGNILNKFNRVVRDLSHELGKHINITLTGAETELDKSLLEAIKDPLTHIVRNSCDHGIETPEVRRNSGKSDTGSISIRSFHEGGQVVIEVTDDGKGLHKDVLLKKAIEKGLITEVQAKQMPEKDVYNLIFAPGFSTAAAVTNVSGRGVGMDVVKTNIEKFGGTVELGSTAGKGTTTRIKIPLTLAIVPALLVNSGNGIFAIPQVKLSELVRVDQSSESKIEYLQGTPVYRLRGKILPLVDLNKVLGAASLVSESSSAIVNIAVLNGEHGTFGLIVDEVQDTADIVVKPLNRLLKSLMIYSGATILGDGSVALILDVTGLAKVANVGREEENQDSHDLADSQSKKGHADAQDYLLVKVNSPTRHAIVLGYVHRLEEFKRSDIEYSGNQRVLRYRQAILPLVTANQHLGYGEDPASQKDMIPIIVIERAGTLYGIEVDEILDTLTTHQDLDTSVMKQSGIFGNLNMPDELIVVVDPFELISTAYPAAAQHTVSASSTPVEASTARVKRSLKILLAEDTSFFRKALMTILEKEGHQVVSAVDGQEALEILNKTSTVFDLILSDIEMPRLNGFEFARSVRANPKFSSLPMLAVSSRADATYMKKGLDSGFNFYMEKIKPDVLLKAIADYTQDRKSAA